MNKDDKNRQFWKKRRDMGRLNKKLKKKEFKTREEYLGSELYTINLRKKEIRNKWKSIDKEEIEWFKPYIVFDLQYCDILNEKQFKSLGSQLIHSYGKLKAMERPLKVFLYFGYWKN